MSYEMLAFADALGERIDAANKNAWAWRRHAEALERSLAERDRTISGLRAEMSAMEARLEAATEQRDRALRVLAELETAMA